MINKFENEIEYLGHDLCRPECVLTNANGDVFVSDFRGGVTRIDKHGEQTFWGGKADGIGLLQTNGFCLLKDGSFLIAHLGEESGGVYRLTRENQISPWLVEIDDQKLPPTNFVYLDHQDRIWITVSTRVSPRADAYRKFCDDGFIILVDQQGARIVADGLGYTNEVWVNTEGTQLYVNATFSRELIQFDIDNNTLINKKVLTTFGKGTFPDGLTMDQEGYLWVTSIVSNRVIRVAPDGTQKVWLEDVKINHIDWVEQAYEDNKMDREHLLTNGGEVLNNISSLAFADDGILLGCLLGEKIVRIKSGIKGVRPAHWLFQ
ncbi:SMP-30/gluconolactonase/LRE family protein [Vibrio sp. CK2-1]|uniref:SMP-30/gluconolactonase/LRE family protein n=1 Tax=Vibrio sp. CK2-1 TaxID=2912249 RepID=UPI001F354C0D|nr:SMP-30/gluconolactonase/LRE family protein [Vibrio sp. CK2-1]MCF7353172.1 SMP-30/gluconolactonase/LRE family protein [Vibrio sp. CK2-1]